jgi:hypothetical protein
LSNEQEVIPSLSPSLEGICSVQGPPGEFAHF